MYGFTRLWCFVGGGGGGGGGANVKELNENNQPTAETVVDLC